LCGPEGPYFYTWTDSFGNPVGDQQCLPISAPGTYQLTTFDFINGLSAGPCTHIVEAGSGSACTIDGPNSACEGTMVELCGPDGAVGYQWGGPDGFSGSTRCVQARVAGMYSVRVQTDTTACWSVPCEREVAFPPCDTRTNCPVAPWLWRLQCSSDNPEPLFGLDQMAAIGGCVDLRSNTLTLGDPADGFCRVLESRCSLRERALRQMAGVFANVCAYDLRVEPLWGAPRGVNPATQLTLEGVSGTVADWLAGADKLMGQWDSRWTRDPSAKDVYREVIRVGWLINHGLGIGPVCLQRSMSAQAGESLAPAIRLAAGESLEDELRDPDDLLVFESVQPNPSRGPARVIYFVSTAATDEVFVGVYDVAGRLVRELVRGTLTPGRHEQTWDGRDTNGQPMRNGAYFVMGRVGGQRIEARLILLR